jgi:hypothetical protein
MVVHIIPKTANYFRFLVILVSGSYASVILMPHLQRYPWGLDAQPTYSNPDDGPDGIPRISATIHR